MLNKLYWWFIMTVTLVMIYKYSYWEIAEQIIMVYLIWKVKWMTGFRKDKKKKKNKNRAFYFTYQLGKFEMWYWWQKLKISQDGKGYLLTTTGNTMPN